MQTEDLKTLKLPKKKAEILIESINYWKNNDIISQQEYLKLKGSIEPIKFDFSKLAKYSFWISLICLCIAICSVIFDYELIIALGKIFNAPIELKFLTLSLLAGLIYFCGIKRKKFYPNRFYENEAILFIGNVLAAGAIYFLWKITDLYFYIDLYMYKNYHSCFYLLSAFIYGMLAYISRSKLTWIITIFMLGMFYGLMTGYLSGMGSYFMGITHPINFLLFSIVLIASSFIIKEKVFLLEFKSITFKLGLLFLFLCLWILSIFANYQGMFYWKKIIQIELFYWSIIFALAAVGAIYYGIKNDDYASRSFGIVFLFINLYTRFFEYFWHSTHKAIFFSVLAVSFWIIGSKAEKIWNIGKPSDSA